MDTLQALEPQIIWHYFEQILKIPRPSKKEDQIRNFLIDFAEKHQLKYKTDHAGNLLISKSASDNVFENRKTVILQSHMDMVGEKNAETDHDFETDPISAYIDDEWVKAEGTTLGADDGIGIAAQMAILASDDIPHGPLECLFTVDEETGLTGANALEQNFFSGKLLLNLDSEDEGELFIGCAGGVDTLINFTYKRKRVPNGHHACELSVKGLKGGHSGDDIHKGLGNSNKILFRYLFQAEKKYKIRVSDFNGGNLRNAIPREARVLITIPEELMLSLKEDFDIYAGTVADELKHTEPNLKLNFHKADLPEFVIDRKTQKRFIRSNYACPNGVIEWSREIDDMVETSTNLASVKFLEGNRIGITTSQRSSVDSAKQDIAARIRAVFELAKAEVEHSDGYPGWQPDKDSEIVKISVESYKKLFKAEPIVRAIHAGLECGLFLEKYPGLDMISFGPTIKGAHSPDERLHIESTQKFWDLLLDVLKMIPEK